MHSGVTEHLTPDDILGVQKLAKHFADDNLVGHKLDVEGWGPARPDSILETPILETPNQPSMGNTTQPSTGSTTEPSTGSTSE